MKAFKENILCYCIYNRKNLIKTQELKELTYHEEFENPNQCSLIMYHVEWCGYCKRAMPEFKKVMQYDGQILYGNMMNIKMLDCDKNPTITKKEKIESYPTIKLKHNNKTYVYEGERTKQGLLDYLKNMLE